MLKFGSTVLASLLMLLSVPAYLSRENANASAASYSTLGQKKKKLTPPSKRNNSEEVKARLTELFDLCRRDDLDAAAAYFVYRGPDDSRKWKDVYHASDSMERAEVKDICLRIKSYLDTSDGYEFGAIKVEREREGEWHALEVSFRQGNEKKKAIFAFLRIKGRFAIGDID